MQAKLTNKTLQLEKFSLHLKADGILRITYTKGTTIDLPTVLQIREGGLSIVADGKIFFLIDASLANGVTKAAYQYLQKTEEWDRVGGFAILTHSLMARIMGNFSIKRYPVRFPKQLFDKEEAAVTWLKRLMKT